MQVKKFFSSYLKVISKFLKFFLNFVKVVNPLIDLVELVHHEVDHLVHLLAEVLVREVVLGVAVGEAALRYHETRSAASAALV